MQHSPVPWLTDEEYLENESPSSGGPSRENDPALLPEPESISAHLPAEGDKCSAIEIYSEADIRNELKKMSLSGEDEGSSTDAAFAKKRRLLGSLLSERGAARRLLAGSSAMEKAITKVADQHPNFHKASRVILHAIALSMRTGNPMSLPPLLLLGPPGIGKTHFARAVAESLDTGFEKVAMDTVDDSGTLTGHSLSWRASRLGLIAETLLNGSTAAPLILLDEIDKPRATTTDNPVDVLHTMLEVENARTFKDAFLGIPIRADYIFWIATANTTETLAPSLLDRFLVVNLDNLSADHRRRIILATIAEITSELPDFDPEISGECMQLFNQDLSIRQLRRLIRLAFANAVAGRRNRIERSDLIEALSFAPQNSSNRRPIGFGIARPTSEP